MGNTASLKAMICGGVAFIIVGLLLIVVFGRLEYIGTVYSVIGILLVIFGVIWVWKVNRVINKIKGRRHIARRMYAALPLLFLVVLSPLSNIVHAQSSTDEEVIWCYEMYRRVVYVEYIVLGLLVVVGFLAVAPIVLGRTMLGPILQELQPLCAAALIMLIFLALCIYPLHVMFGVHPTKDSCTINTELLRTQGPPILRIILNLIIPPRATFGP